MPLEVGEPCGLGAGQEVGVAGGVGQGEGHVHPGPRALLNRVGVEVGGVDVAVEKLGLGAVALGHCLQAAAVLDPVADEPQQVDGEGGRRVEHGVGVGHLLVVQDGGGHRAGPPQQVLAHDDDGQARGPHVLLSPGVDEAVAGDVDGPREDRGGEVGHQRDLAGLGHVVELDAADGLVGRVVQIAGGLGHREGAGLGSGRVGGGGLVGGHDDVELVGAGLLDGLSGPLAGVEVGDRVTGGGQVEGDAGELGAGPALEEEHAVVVGHGQEAAQGGLGVGRAGHEVGPTVGDLQDGHSRSAPAGELGGSLLEDGQGELGRTGGEIENAHGVIMAAYARGGNVVPHGDDASHSTPPRKASTIPSTFSLADVTHRRRNAAGTPPERGRTAAQREILMSSKSTGGTGLPPRQPSTLSAIAQVDRSTGR